MTATSWGVGFTLAAALATFLVVQDRITAAGAREYVTRQEASAAGSGPVVTIDEVMRPAVRRSVRIGLLAGGVVLAAGLAVAFSVERWRGPRGASRGPSRR
jgi:ABC-type Fe3+ transport system permease subunit